jgi:hypothetical protein
MSPRTSPDPHAQPSQGRPFEGGPAVAQTGNDVRVSRRRFMVLAAVLVALNAFFWLTQVGAALPQAVIDRFFGPRLIRAEVVVRAGPGVVNDFRIDRGVITAATPGSIVVRERDGTFVTIEVEGNARVIGSASVTGVSQLRRGLRVLVVRKANAPAHLIEVESRG